MRLLKYLETKKYSSLHCIFIEGLAHVKPNKSGFLGRQELLVQRQM